ncbi:sorbosone dehydrogenase family protein [Frigoribacterium sp. VKM Ac-2836]|uniref:PQQ-dependent sugar dehydrogenase n=1 Tax=Frigoribacterium sp. VKM Ac-2836 TaxID=2739014 RepID=UPI001563756C|nr:PQQ-dependent sugar dehydrogenase [Frigoribacterium sp. VKM Ac-2836]NRD26611.1 PQQ-dependent sugar dehydrogenase [Frigoribacterium sp. VKM Ac-2836]
MITTPRTTRHRLAVGTMAAVTAVLLVGCTAGADATASGGQAATRPASEAPTDPTADAGPGPVAPTTDTTAVTVAADAEPTDVATGLDAPWSVVRLDTGSSFVSLRDTGTVLELLADGSTREAGTIGGVVHEGEGGLLGLAVLAGSPSYLYAYATTADDNRVVRAPITGEAGSYGLGEQDAVITGIPKASNHDGGRLAFGPDGLLYVTTGDANQRPNAQDPGSLGGKVLRATEVGGVPDDNPSPDSLVYTLGHRNPQGIAWDATGVAWAAEFGQNTYDELNALEPGANYGWPEVEGRGETAGFTNPVLQWSTDDASPSGLAAVGTTLYLAGLGGEKLFEIQVAPDSEAVPTELFAGSASLGRIRDVLPGPDGTLWLVTNNADGRGTPSAGDDRIVSVPLTAAP